MANIAKYKTTTCQPGTIHTGMLDEAFSWRIKGERDTYRERLRQRIPCPYFRMELTAGSVNIYCRRLHGTEKAIDWDRPQLIQTENLTLVYEVRLLTDMKSCQCPFPGCPGNSWIRIALQKTGVYSTGETVY